MAVLIRPGSWFKTGGVDHERVSLPFGHRDPIPARAKAVQILAGWQFPSIHPQFAYCPSPLEQLQDPPRSVDEFDGLILLPHDSGKTNRIACVCRIVGACAASTSWVLYIFIFRGLAYIYRHTLAHRFRTSWSECRTSIFSRTFTRRGTFPESAQIARIKFSGSFSG